MTKRLLIALSFLLIALPFNGNKAKAQELAALPSQIQGNWALPDCGIYSEALVFSRYFYLKSSEEGLSLHRAGLERQAEDYAILSFDSRVAPVQVENDGILTIGVMDKPPARRPRNWPHGWDSLNVDQKIEYTACTEPPSLIPSGMARMMRYIDRLRDACAVSDTGNCARVMFKFADADNNQKVDAAEIKKATQTVLLFAELAALTTIPSDDLKPIHVRGDAEGKKIAADLVARYDSNNSKSLDYNELVTDFSPPALPIVREMADKAARLLPSLKIVAMALPHITENDMPAQKKSKRDY